MNDTASPVGPLGIVFRVDLRGTIMYRKEQQAGRQVPRHPGLVLPLVSFGDRDLERHLSSVVMGLCLLWRIVKSCMGNFLAT
jgi:hypothetical protein